MAGTNELHCSLIALILSKKLHLPLHCCPISNTSHTESSSNPSLQSAKPSAAHIDTIRNETKALNNHSAQSGKNSDSHTATHAVGSKLRLKKRRLVDTQGESKSISSFQDHCNSKQSTQGSSNSNPSVTAVEKSKNDASTSSENILSGNDNGNVKSTKPSGPVSIDPTISDSEKKQLLNFLPSEHEYDVLDLKFDPSDDYIGAHKFPFVAVVSTQGLGSFEATENWVKDFENLNRVQFRKSKSPWLGKYVKSQTYHCQHRSRNYFSRAPCKKKRASFQHGLRKKGAECTANLKITYHNSTQKRAKYPAKTCVITIDFRHSHTLHSAYALSFRDISIDTVKKYEDLFKAGHSASSARHTYEINLQLSSSEDTLLDILADRSINPRAGDVNNLYQHWRRTEIGPLDGKSMFDDLEHVIGEYNEHHKAEGGCAFLIPYEENAPETPGEHTYHKKRKCEPIQPLIICICTPLMSRVHTSFPQSAEIAFCDATASLDTHGCSCFILSTATAGALPLGVVITSEESAEVLKAGFSNLKKVLPGGSFYGRGSDGPQVFMTDDSASKKDSLHYVFPNSKQILCSFHFLQAVWRWLWNANNQITDKVDRQTLMQAISSILYCKTEKEMNELCDKFRKGPYFDKYPKLSDYFERIYVRRREWAICYRGEMITRGYNTNNYAEVGIRVLKERIFQRTKAYNIQQMFGFITETLELYMQRKLLSLALSRNDQHISNEFLGLKPNEIPRDNIKPISNSSFEVLSSKGDKTYWVDIKAGICSCGDGKNGTLCKHQSAVIQHHKPEAANLFSVPITPSGHMLYAKIALGGKLDKGIDFFACIHGKKTPTCIEVEDFLNEDPDFCSDSVNSAVINETEYHETDCTKLIDHCKSESELQASARITLENLSLVVDDMQRRVDGGNGDPDFVTGLNKFCTRYLCTLGKNPLFATSQLASKLHQFGISGSYWKSKFKKAKLSSGCHIAGKKIPVQPTGAARRRTGLSQGRRTVKVGRPLGSKIQKRTTNASMFFGRKSMKANVPHTLSESLTEARLNAS